MLLGISCYCDTQKQSSGNVPKKGVLTVLKHLAKFIEKQLCQSLFFYKIAGRLEKRFQHVCFPIIFTKFFKNTFGRLILDMHFFQAILTRIPDTFGTFRERFIFEIIRLSLLLMAGSDKSWSQSMLISPVTGWNSDYIDEFFMQTWTLRKLETFYAFMFELFPQRQRNLWKL